MIAEADPADVSQVTASVMAMSAGNPPTWGQICARRLDRHGLTSPLPDVISAVRAMASAHAQVMSAAELAIGLRTEPDPERRPKQMVEAALWQDQDLIKTYGLRGTIHLMPAEDYGGWTAALDAITRPPQIKDVMTGEQIDRVLDALDQAVAEGPMTIAELDQAVVTTVGPWAGDLVVPNFGGWAPRWRHALGAACRRGVICLGPSRGRSSTFQRAPRVQPAPDALGWLVTTFLRSYGPATPEHFARWTTAPRKVAIGSFAAADLVDVGTGFVNRGDDGWPEPTNGLVRLLPYFDPYTIGCHPRTELFAGTALARAAPNGSAGNYPVVLIDGTVAGIWHQRRSGSKIQFTVEALGTLLTAHRERVVEQAERIAGMAGGTAVVAFDSVRVASHR